MAFRYPSSADLEWERVLLGGASSSSDPNSLLSGSVTETAGNNGSTSLTISSVGAPSAYSDPTTGLLYTFGNLKDYNGNDMAWSDVFDFDLNFEIITEPANDSRFVMYGGLTSDTTNDQYFYGFGYRKPQSTPGIVIHDNSSITGSNNANLANTYGRLLSGSDAISNFLVNTGTDSSDEGINNLSLSSTTRRLPNSLSDPVTFFVLFGVSGTGATSNATVEFRLWKTPVTKKPS